MTDEPRRDAGRRVPQGGHEQETDLRDTQPGDRETGDFPGMGVSSERVGSTGPGQVGTEGVKDTSDEDPARADVDTAGDAETVRTPDGGEAVPEQSEGLPEVSPDGVGTRGHHERNNPGHTHG